MIAFVAAGGAASTVLQSARPQRTSQDVVTTPGPLFDSGGSGCLAGASTLLGNQLPKVNVTHQNVARCGLSFWIVNK
jgi:hypothetical protein